jgi:hypothetical protein
MDKHAQVYIRCWKLWSVLAVNVIKVSEMLGLSNAYLPTHPYLAHYYSRISTQNYQFTDQQGEKIYFSQSISSPNIGAFRA